MHNGSLALPSIASIDRRVATAETKLISSKQTFLQAHNLTHKYYGMAPFARKIEGSDSRVRISLQLLLVKRLSATTQNTPVSFWLYSSVFSQGQLESPSLFNPKNQG